MDILFQILYGIFTLGILIVVHELGHFVAGKLTGIRVTAFSIGFGRGIISFTRGDTLYKLGWLPVGGYCRFAGEGEDLSDDRKGEPDEFYERPAWARLITVSAGVIFNFIFAIFIYWILAMNGSSYISQESKITVIDKQLLQSRGSSSAQERMSFPALAAGMRHGDKIISINGNRVGSFWDISRMVQTRGDEKLRIKVLRGEREHSFVIHTGIDSSMRGYINVTDWASPVLGIVSGGGRAFKAGLRSGDRILTVNGQKVDNSHYVLYRLLSAVTAKSNINRTLKLTYRRYQSLDRIFQVPSDRLRRSISYDKKSNRRFGFRIVVPAGQSILKTGDRILTFEKKPVVSFTTFRKRISQSKKKKVRLTFVSFDSGGNPRTKKPKIAILPLESIRSIGNLQPIEMKLQSNGGILYRAGLRNGDRILSINGKPIFSSTDFMNRSSHASSVRIRVARGRVYEASIQLPRGSNRLGVQSQPDRYVFSTPPVGPFSAIGASLNRFVDSFPMLVGGITKIFKKGVKPGKALGGPLSLIGLSGSALKDTSFQNWLRLLALLSIAIGFMNLLPIPALDGGHIILTIVELIRRKRMSFKVLQRIQLVGIVILFSLFIMVISLDLMKLGKIFH